MDKNRERIKNGCGKQRERERGELKDKLIIGGVLSNPSRNRDDDWEIVCYVLDLNTGEVVSSLPSIFVPYCCWPSIAAVGSQLFLFGGGGNSVSSASGGGVVVDDDSAKPKNRKKKGKNNKKKKKNQGLGLGLCSARRLDLSKPNDGWRLAAATATTDVVDDQAMGVVEFGGKLFVIGHSESESGFVCEVFDPHHNNNNWRRLKSPPFPSPPPPEAEDDEVVDPVERTLITLPVLADARNSRIIFRFQMISAMYAYYPHEDQWRCVDDDFNDWFSGGEPVALADDGVIYIYTRRRKEFFRAYHTGTKQWLSVRLSPVAEAEAEAKVNGRHHQPYLYYSEYRTLLHRGNGLLCLLSSINPQYTSVHVVQIKVELINDDKEVLVTPFSSQYFRLPSCCHPYLHLPVV